MLPLSPGGAEHKPFKEDVKDAQNDIIELAESKTSVDLVEPPRTYEDGKAESKDDRRQGREEHQHRLRQMRTDRLREVQEKYLEGLRVARQQYFEARKQAARAKRNMFEPSPQMLDHIPIGNMGIGPPLTPSLSSTRNLSRTRFWEEEAGAATGKATSEEAELELVLTEEEIEQEIDRLKMRAMEVEAVLRVQFDEEDCVEQCRAKLEACSTFYERLGSLASTLNVLKGAAFQELLGRGTGNPRGHINRDRVIGLVKLEEALSDQSDRQKMILGAEALCDLVRVKIEDDNDLGLALSVVGDSLDFLSEMARLAKFKSEDEHSFLQMLRKF